MISPYEIILRLLLGALLGGIIGFERQTHGRPAGFRTQLLVCVASVLLMIISEYYHHLSLMDPSYIRVDPARLAAGAITGVGFLGAGVIVKTGINVQGLTTAACIWIVSAIGLAIGSGLYFAGIASAVITFFSLWLLRMAEEKMPGLSYKFMSVIMKNGGDVNSLTSILQRLGSTVSEIDYERDMEKMESVYRITFSYKNSGSIETILNEVSSLQFVKKVTLHG